MSENTDDNPYIGLPDHVLAEKLAAILTPAGREGHPLHTSWAWTTFGLFHATWGSIELVTDLAVARFLNIAPETSHLITSGMMFGKKARLLADLIGRSNHPKRTALLTELNTIRGKGKRDVFVHGYITSTDDGRIEIVERTQGGQFSVKRHSFTRRELSAHVQMVWNSFQAFGEALGVTNEELSDFIGAASRASRKEMTSPG